MRRLIVMSVLAAAAMPAAAAEPLTLASFQARIEAKFARTDANRDGFVTAAEADAAAASRPDREQRLAARERRQGRRAERLARLDTDKDGAVSAAARAARAAARGPGDAAARAERRAERRSKRQALRGSATLHLGEKRFARLDADKDGRLSLQEMSARAARRFGRLDRDRDGLLTREERREARALRRAQRNG